ncbi:hypothetical protein CDES_11515 [Corynebacterium deserti GIMN1.010]|uniref:DUF1648 domain-containing protein n=1 Tax=Corynebacterium deserti GIMN1.010 TaxID=931089 RepID=A0A0M4CRC0_9CORY|nr:DUF1648 domain-containing protein [Corynebacterium deserti]ALC06667.1 hypothetical protein CDES_11515 [Corynebacterium deserti GIMN1.010]
MIARANDMPNLPKLPFNWVWPLIAIGSTVALTALALIVFYPNLPDPMPTHWNADLEADSWSPKTVTNFLFLLLLGPVITILTLLGVQAMLVMQSGAITGPGGAKTANEAHRQWETYKATMTHMGWYLCLLNVIVLVMVINSLRAQPFAAGFVLSLVAIGVATVALVWVLLKKEKEIVKKYPRSPEDQAKRWGIFFNDPDDKRILIENSPGMNFTFNVGHTPGKIAAATVLGLPILILVVVIAV